MTTRMDAQASPATDSSLSAQRLGPLLRLGWKYARDAMYVAECDTGILVDLNPAAEASTGYSRQELIGQHLTLLHPEAEREVILDALHTPSAAQASIDGLHLMCRNGRRLPVSLSVSEPFRADGRNLRIATLRDTSELDAAEQSIALLASIVESSQDAICSIDRNGLILTWNRQSQLLFGYTSQEAISKNISILFPPERLHSVKDIIHAILSGGAVKPFETSNVHQDGSLIDVSVCFSPLRSRSGAIIGCSAVIRDIRERKLAELRRLDSDERYRATFEQAPIGILHTSLDGKFLRCNARFASLIGYTAEEIPHLSFSQITHPDDLQLSNEKLQELLNGVSGMPSFEKRYIRKDGSEVWARLTLSLRRDRKGQLLHCITLVEDISARKEAEYHLAQAQMALAASEKRFRTVFETSLDAISISRQDDGTFIEVNDAFLALCGYSRQEVIGHSSFELNLWVNPEDRERMLESFQSDSPHRGVEIPFRRKNGEIVWGMVSASPIEIDGVPCHQSAVRDISDLKAAREEIKVLAFYDPLTAVANRRLFIERLQQSLAASARSAAKRALLFIDLDNFKSVNDNLGHPAGDLLLREVARRLSAATRKSDTVARIGGDEFVVMLENLDASLELAAAQARRIADSILLALSQPYMLDGREALSGASIGISLFGNQSATVDDLLRQADFALYQAKSAGRNMVQFFSPVLQTAAQRRTALEQELRRALLNQQFTLYFQPQIDNDRLVAVEALVRWNHPQQGLLAPADFLPLAEQTGLVLPIEAWILDAVCAQAAIWGKRRETAHLSIALNVSASQIRQRDFVEKVLQAIDRAGADPSRIVLEVGEAVLATETDDLISTMSQLRAHGIRFALDGFGSGASCLAALKHLPLDQLKLHRSFLRDIPTDPASCAIAQTIIFLGLALGLPVVAEGVETVEQREFLVRLGCHIFQGYLFSFPLSLGEFERLITPPQLPSESIQTEERD